MSKIVFRPNFFEIGLFGLPIAWRHSRPEWDSHRMQQGICCLPELVLSIHMILSTISILLGWPTDYRQSFGLTLHYPSKNYWQFSSGLWSNTYLYLYLYLNTQISVFVFVFVFENPQDEIFVFVFDRRIWVYLTNIFQIHFSFLHFNT